MAPDRAARDAAAEHHMSQPLTTRRRALIFTANPGIRRPRAVYEGRSSIIEISGGGRGGQVLYAPRQGARRADASLMIAPLTPTQTQTPTPTQTQTPSLSLG